MIEAIAGIFGSAGLGGITGVIGSFLTGRAKAKEAQAARQHDLAMRKLDQEETRLDAELALKRTETEAGIRLQETEIERQIASDRADVALKKASYAHDKSLDGGWFINGLRALMRPMITVVLLVMTGLWGWAVWSAVDGLEQMAHEQLMAALLKLIDMAVFLTNLAVSWWFGDRALNKRLKA